MGRFCHFFPISEYVDFAHCVHCESSKTARFRQLCSQPTQWKKYGSWPTALSNIAAFIVCTDRNTAQSRMECSRHSQLFRRYRCTQQHPCFYALTTLFPSISRYKRSHTCADKQDSISNDDPIFSPTHVHSVKQPIPRVLSALIMMAITRIHAPSLLLCLFILSHCLDPHHGDNKTDIDQSVLACSHTFNVYASTPHSPSRCQHVPPAPPSTLLLTARDMPYFLRASDL